VLSHEEQRRFDEIAHRIDQETAATDPHTAPIPTTSPAVAVRLTALGLLVVGVAGVLTGFASSDLVALTVVGVVLIANAIILVAFAGTPGTAHTPPVRAAAGRLDRDPLMLKQLWVWLTTCATDGCSNRPVRLGWCSDHAPGYTRRRDEYWGDYWDDPEGDRR
jgi:hypothetical protein